ncbi:BQ5605_C027g10379 [Microbotryum silenes-dioicae]|uniref:BQ5605_C027g10379 protein n=1 Tax=Microbotryum silenes-dioicae TaxID=796604 RepID=A0A2X0PGR1_9BASI|nr:BQ5605_C027g10379 [Microbotryum silenes-dioicae]
MHFAKASLSLGINVITLTNHFVAAKSDAVATPELCGKGGRKKDPVTTLICSDASSVCRDIKWSVVASRNRWIPLGD